jgi:hypothetical protein
MALSLIDPRAVLAFSMRGTWKNTRYVCPYSKLEFIIHKSYVSGLVDINDRPLKCVTNMDPAIIFGVLLYFFGLVALVTYSAHRRKKQMSQQPAQQPPPQPSPRSVLRSHQEPEKEDL